MQRAAQKSLAVMCLACSRYGAVKQTIDAAIREAQEQFVLDSAASPPGNDGAACVREFCLDALLNPLVTVPQNCCPVSQSQKDGGALEATFRLATAGVQQCDALSRYGSLSGPHTIEIDATHKPNFTGTLTNENRGGKESIRVQAHRALDVVVGADYLHDVAFLPASQDKELVARQLPEHDRRVC